MYIFGGFVAGTRSSELFSYDFAKNEWAQLGKDQKDGPEPRAGCSLVSHGGDLYSFGGHNEENERINELWCYNIASDKWSHIEHNGDVIPNARSGHTATEVNNLMVVFGGILEVTKEINDMYAFDFVSKEWKIIYKESKAKKLKIETKIET
jgi:N-acetylneuraminic acid mutarotase